MGSRIWGIGSALHEATELDEGAARYINDNRARRILWLVTGTDKVAALARLREGDLTIPAGRIRRTEALLLADKLAAGPL